MAESILQQSRRVKRIGRGGLKGKIMTVAIIAFVGVGAYYGYAYFTGSDNTAKNQADQERTAVVTKDDIQLAVENDGTVVAEDGVELSFSITGETVTAIYVEEGDYVAEGDKIASISTTSLEYDLENAQDSYENALLSYNEEVAGASEKEIKESQYQVEQAETSLAQAKSDLEQTKIDAEENVADAEEAIEDAQEALEVGSSGNNKVIDDAYSDLYDSLESISISLKNNLYSADKILGIDDVDVNDDFEGVLGALNYSSLYAAQSSYESLKDERQDLEDMLSSADYTDYEEVEAAAAQAQIAAASAKSLFVDLQSLLDYTITSSSFSQSELDSLKSTVSSARTSANNYPSTITSALEGLDDADDSLENLQDAYDDAVKNLEDVKRQNEISIENAEISVRNKEISLDQTNMSYEELIEPLSALELQNLRMKVNQALNNLKEVQEQIEDATLTAPISGQVSNINGEVGSLISENSSESFCTIINKDTLFVQVDVEEGDITQIEKGQKAYVTFDAVDDLELTGEVTYISMTAGSSSSGVVTYEVRVVLQNVGETDVREGMSAYVKFVSDEVSDVLTIPVGAVTNVNGVASVQMEDGTYQAVVTGFTDGETVEILSGLKEGDRVIY